MQLQASSSRLTQFLIKLKGAAKVKAALYQKAIQLVIENNKDIANLFESYENGLSEAEFLKQLEELLQGNKNSPKAPKLMMQQSMRSSLELTSLFKNKVKLLQNITKATAAFRSKQLVINNIFFRNSALVMYLPDYDLKKIMTENEKMFMSNNVEKYHSMTQKQEYKKNEKFANKFDTLKHYKPVGDLLEENKELQAQLRKFDFNLLDSNQNQDKVVIVHNLFQMCSYARQVEIPQEEFCNFITILKHQYNKRQNSFHNFVHGVNVMHGCYSFAHHEFFGQYFSELQKFILVFSGLCHDVNHTGTTNMFEVNANSKLAIRYNDKSVLENHHIAQTYKIMSYPRCDILVNIGKQDRLYIRKLFINNVLATDNQTHFSVLNNIEIKMQALPNDPKIFDLEENKFLLSGFLTHASDFFGAIKPYQIAREWSEQLRMEFQAQSALEEKKGIAQTPYLKNLEDEYYFAKNEAGFLKVIVLPIYETLNKFSTGSLEDQVQNISQSIQNYEQIVKDEETKKEQR